jgi:hypothetical protein
MMKIWWSLCNEERRGLSSPVQFDLFGKDNLNPLEHMGITVAHV